ncbi:MAG: glutamate--tRNA ligase [Candidatus Babeliales bacterium]|jgi:glutamyl-tRNA synthetase
MNNVRTRFAPSPTGYLHVGGLRTALYSFLYAKKHNGSFLLRIEDTDQKRSVPGAVENIISTLAWAGITFDEGPGKEGAYGPYIQSQRLELYHKHALELVEKGHAYYCFCSSERLEKIRAIQTAQKRPPCYDRHCRDLAAEIVAERLRNKEPYVIRMKVPLEGECVFNDIIRGTVAINYNNVDDQVLIKSDGFPTYHLAVVVDDHFMQISHVIRGEEWLPSTPKHVLLYQYFGWTAPAFAHLPLLLNPDKSKLSKRQGDVAVEDYRAKGYLAEALVNFIAFLGWNPGDTREIFTLDELIKEFSLERVGKSGAIFNLEKLQWLNQQHIHRATHERLLQEIKPLLKEKGWDNHSDAYLGAVIDLLKERVTVIPEFLVNGQFFFVEPTSYDEKAKAKCWTAETVGYLNDLAKQFASLIPLSASAVEQAVRTYAQEKNISASVLIHPLRLALTGVSAGPSLFHLIEVLGKEAVARRLAAAIKVLG